MAAVFGFCVRFCEGDRGRASDLAQEAFATAWTHLSDVREPERFSGWLMTITRRTCLQSVARDRREKRALIDLHAEPRPPTRSVNRAASIVAEVIAACPDAALREVASLFYIEPGHETLAIAERLGVSRSVVTTRLYRFRIWAKTRMLGRLTEALEETL
ncbi:MAG: sigma-70 family RNA polymerase sigma factor [Proteobacteria bacterium]|nr:sigma-70 family RNA polymerase sigma factor [Pseudomonadota bacterium]